MNKKIGITVETDLGELKIDKVGRASFKCNEKGLSKVMAGEKLGDLEALIAGLKGDTVPDGYEYINEIFGIRIEDSYNTRYERKRISKNEYSAVDPLIRRLCILAIKFADAGYGRGSSDTAFIPAIVIDKERNPLKDPIKTVVKFYGREDTYRGSSGQTTIRYLLPEFYHRLAYDRGIEIRVKEEPANTAVTPKWWRLYNNGYRGLLFNGCYCPILHADSKEFRFAYMCPGNAISLGVVDRKAVNHLDAGVWNLNP